MSHIHTEDNVYVYHCNVNTGKCTIVAKTEKNVDNLAFDAKDQIYVSNMCNGSIYEIKKNGKVKLISPSGLIGPGGIAVMSNDDGGESIYVAEYWTVKEFDTRNGKPKGTGFFGLYDGPMTVKPDGENLILSSWFGNIVQVWNPESKTILEKHYFNVPMNAVRFQEDLVVAELGTGSVVRQDHVTGQRTTLASVPYMPTGLAYTDDDLWVAEWYTGVVYQVVADGIVQNPPLFVTGGLVKPEGMVMDHDGNLLVIESGIGQLTCIDPATGEKTVLAEGLATGLPTTPTFPATFIFSDVAVGEEGDIYVTGDVDNVVYKIRVKKPKEAITEEEHSIETAWGNLEVTMPKNKAFNFNLNLLSWLFERFPNTFPILRQILGL